VHVEDEIIKALEDIMNLRISLGIAKFVAMEPELEMSKEQFTMFREWLISKGFIEVEADASGTPLPLLKHLLILLGYTVFTDKSRRRLRYVHSDGKKAVSIIYILGEVVTIEDIIYFEVS
jgi:hypothetical protein